MGLIYAFIRIYPFFAVGMLIALVDIAIAMRRKGMKKQMVMVIILGVIFFVTGILWIVMRGDLHAEEWFAKLNSLLFMK